LSTNPNWPNWEEAISFLNTPTSTPNPKTWVDVTSRTQGSATVTRGRQYEKAQTQTGTGTLTLRNADGAFNPDNTSSQFYPLVLPYRGYRKRAQYPATVNRLTASQATAGVTTYDDFGVSTTLAAGVLPAYVSQGASYALSTDGSGHYTSAIPSSPAANTQLMWFSGFSFAPGTNYTGQVTVTSTASCVVQVIWRTTFTNGTTTTTGAVGSTVTASGSPQVVSSNYTTPTNIIGLELGLLLVSGSASATLSTSKVQVNAGSLATYATPGPWYPIFTGYIQQFPQTWTDGGTNGLTTVSIIDAFGWFANQKLHSPAYHELLVLSPTFAYFLDEPQTASSVVDATSNQNPITFQDIQSGGSGVVGTTLGGTNAPKGDWSDAYPPRGIGGPVATFANYGTGGATVLDLGDAGSQVGPPSNSAWTRIWAFRAPVGSPAAKGQGIWGAFAPGDPTVGFSGYTLAIGGSFQGDLQFSINNFGSSTFNTISLSSSISVLDGYWHLAIVTCASDGKTITGYYDGSALTPVTSASDLRINCSYPGVEFLGAEVYPGQTIQSGYTGDLAYVGGLSVALSAAQVSLLYSTFRYGGSGLGTASSASRFADILRWAQWNGSQAEDNYLTGSTVTYGPATELLASRDQTGTDVVSALQTVVDTENGMDYVARNGAITLKGRRARYNLTTAATTFGENNGEVHYNPAAFAYDPLQITTDAQLTQTPTGSVVRYIDPNSTAFANYGDIQIQRNVNTLNLLEVDDAATFLVQRYEAPKQRLQSITIPVSSYTESGAAASLAWTEMLQMELGLLVQVNRRPAGAQAISYPGFVEQIGWTNDDQGNASCTLQISPQGTLSYWTVGSTRLNVHTATTVNGTSLVIDALADAATNVLAANISRAGDQYFWIVGYGTAQAELITITAVPTTTLGYSTATLTVGTCMRLDTGATGTGFRFVHAINSTVQDIGGYYSAYGLTYSQVSAALAPYINPAGALDSLCTVGVSTICGY